MGDRTGDATALLGMDDFVVSSQAEEDGEDWLFVEASADVVSFRSCAVRGGRALAVASSMSVT